METLGESKVLSFSLSSVKEGNEEVGWVSDSLQYPQAWKASPQTFRKQGGLIYPVRSFCKWLSQWWVIFILLGVDATLGNEVRFENTYTVSGKWKRFESYYETY